MNCLFCLNTVNQTTDLPNLTQKYNIFYIFSKYLHVSFENDFAGDEVPMCLPCQGDLKNMESIADKLDVLIQEITKIFATVCSKVIESEKKLKPFSISGKKRFNVAETGEKFHSIRKSIIQSFDAKISLPDCIARRPLRTKKKGVETSDWYTLDQFPFDEPNSPTSEPAEEDPDFELEENTAKKRVRNVSNMGELKQRLKRKHNQSKKTRKKETDKSHSTTRVPRVVLDLGDGKFEYLGYDFIKVLEGYQCSSCNYTSRSSIRQNILFHIKGKHRDMGKFGCTFPNCGKIFGSNKHLLRHKEVHNDNRSHMCELCGRFCKTKKSLKDHKARHEGKLIQECSICQKKMSNKTVLQLHIKTVHEGLKEFQCHLCALNVTTSQSLKRHMLTHGPKKEKPVTFDVPNRPFACEVCDSRFPAKTNLNYHMQTVHASEKNFECDVCHRKFAKMKLLRRHAYSHSEDRNEICPTCGKQFKNLVYLKNHLKRHEVVEKAFECDICHVKLGTKASLVFHVSTVHEKQRNFSCQLCNKKFYTSHALKRHGGTHTTERPYGCDQCGGRYQQYCTLKRHIMEVHEKIPPKNPRKTPLQRRILKEEKQLREMEYKLRQNKEEKSTIAEALPTGVTETVPETHDENLWNPNILVVDTVTVSQMKPEAWTEVEADSVPTAITVIHTATSTPVHFSTDQKFLIPTNACDSAFTEFPDPNYFTQEIRDCRNYLRDST